MKLLGSKLTKTGTQGKMCVEKQPFCFPLVLYCHSELSGYCAHDYVVDLKASPLC